MDALKTALGDGILWKKSSHALLFVEVAMIEDAGVKFGGGMGLLHIHIDRIKPGRVTWMKNLSHLDRMIQRSSRLRKCPAITAVILHGSLSCLKHPCIMCDDGSAFSRWMTKPGSI